MSIFAGQIRQLNKRKGERMRFLVIVKASKDSEAGKMPSEEMLAQMGKFNEELANAGVMLAGEGLHPTSKGKRIKFSGDKRKITDGPFGKPKDLIAGYWLWKCESWENAIEGRNAYLSRKVKWRFVKFSKPKISARSLHRS
jgi:hypothetical protein